MRTEQMDRYIKDLKEECKRSVLMDGGINGDYRIDELDKDVYIKVLEKTIRTLLLNFD